MAIKPYFNPYRQLPELMELESNGLIHQFGVSYMGHIAEMNYHFRLGALQFNDAQSSDALVRCDFSKYTVEIWYGRYMTPTVFVAGLDSNAPHRYRGGALCLYKPKNFKWFNQDSIAKTIFPLICTWLYFYEVWQQTGWWKGAEAKHKPLWRLQKKLSSSRTQTSALQPLSNPNVALPCPPSINWKPYLLIWGLPNMNSVNFTKLLLNRWQPNNDINLSQK
jgi:hypothetical protein